MSTMPAGTSSEETVVYPKVQGASAEQASGGQVGAHVEPAGSADAVLSGLDAALPHPERGELEMHAVLHALSDPMRLRIVAELAGGGEHTCSSFDLPIVKSTCTHHFRVLREAGLIRQRIVGTTKVNSLRHEDLEARFPGLLDAVLTDFR